MPPVPTVAQVVPGAAVSIVLKADQPTGRQVQGIVQDLLTRGNHPRGIKVRLSDGRVGRVQRMHVGDLPASSQQQQPSPQPFSSFGSKPPTTRSLRPSKFQSRDVRNEDGGGEPASEYDLFSFVREAKPKKRGPKAQNEAPNETEAGSGPGSAETITVTCPVCGDFKGDEAAVAHHVETHFD